MTVFVLITWDVDPDLWLPTERRQWAFNMAMDICHHYKIPATFFITAQTAHVYHTYYEKLAQQKHEIGCHGWTHGTEENYDHMSFEQQQLYLKIATTYLQSQVGHPIRVFRSPRVKTSAITQQLLSDLGYLADSSVCSQRFDLISSNLINIGWLFAPRQPYHPAVSTPYQSGNLPIWQIPVSATLLPFISSLMQVTGLNLMKLFFRQLYWEAKQTGKPIVYLAHPSEFIGHKVKNKRIRWRAHLKPEHFSPTFIRAHGFRMRALLYRHNPADILHYTKQLFAYMTSFSDITFLTMGDYVRHLNHAHT